MKIFRVSGPKLTRAYCKYVNGTPFANFDTIQHRVSEIPRWVPLAYLLMPTSDSHHFKWSMPLMAEFHLLAI